MNYIFRLTNGRPGPDVGWFSRTVAATGILRTGLPFAVLFGSVCALHPIAAAGQTVALAWNPSPDANVAGYNLYYGGASRVYTNITNVGNVTNATVLALAPGMTYFIAATAFDNFGNQSAFSSEISYTVPVALPLVQIHSESAGQVILSVTGQIGHTNDILATQDFITWTVIGTVTTGGSAPTDFTDPDSANIGRRFYRTHEVP